MDEISREVCEDLQFGDLLTGQAPVPARSTAQVDPETSQHYGAGKDSHHPRDDERSPLKERRARRPPPAAEPELRPRGDASGKRRAVRRHRLTRVHPA